VTATAHSPPEVDASSWEAILIAAEVLREDDTTIAGPIRVLAFDDALWVQEQAPDGRLLLRRFNDRAADRFVDRRLETYDRMWDGCGCKIDYDEP
jgi:hypothetical protein